MVWFQCEDCGDNLKKPKLPNHLRTCSASKLSCIDCGQVFEQQSVEGHTQCITESEKYGPKANTKSKNDSNQKPEIDVNVGFSERPPWFCSLCNTKTTSKQTLLLHAGGKKHRAKARGFHASKQQPIDAVGTTDLTEKNGKNEVPESNGLGESRDQNSSKITSLHDNMEVETHSLKSDKKRKLVDRARDERAHLRNSEHRNGDNDSLVKMKAAEDTLEAKEKQKPSFELFGKLAAETNRYGVEQRLKSFLGQLQTESGILQRIVYKHKNQHRRCSYFQYVLKVRRDLNLLKSVNLEEILGASFLVINEDKPKQKVQLLESLKRRRSDGGKYNFLERLLGAERLLSQMVEPLLRAAMEISTLLAQSFFMKFSLTTLAVLARIRVLVQQVLVDAALVYNHVSSLSQREHTIKLNQEGFEVFREYYPKKMEATVTLDCIWQIDKYVLVERTDKSVSKSQEKDDRDDVLIQPSNIQYDNMEAFLGEDESDPIDVELVSAEPIDGEESSVNHLEKNVQNDSHRVGSSCLNLVSHKSQTCGEKLMEEGSLTASCSTAPLVNPVKHKSPIRKKSVAFVSVNPRRTPSTANQSKVQMRGID